MRRDSNLRDFEWHLLFIAVVLSIIGITFIWSATQNASEMISRKSLQQVVFLVFCFPCILVVLRIGYPFFSRYAYSIYFILLISLAILLLRGGNVSRWYNIAFGIRLQPSEFMKLGVIFTLSRYFIYPRKHDLTTWTGLIPPLALTLAPMVLIIKQPDLGTALVILPVALGMLYIAGFPGKRLALFILIGLICIPVVYSLPILKDYQRERVKSFLISIPRLENEALALRKEGNKEDAVVIEKKIRTIKRDSGFQQFRSMVSVGSGGLIGQGLGRGPQNRLNLLPERHTDFIFAIIGEEWGFFGCSVVLLLFFLMVAIILGVAKRTRDPFGRYLCSGVALLFLTQAFLNTAISVGLLPITGLTLPFVSYGGSSLLSSFMALALVLDVGRRRVRVF